MLLIALTRAISIPVPIDLDAISPDHVRTLRGLRVLATFLIAKPQDYTRGISTISAVDGPDGSERGAQLRGRRLDIEFGSRVYVVGTLRVTDWPADYVDGVLVPWWVGVVVRE